MGKQKTTSRKARKPSVYLQRAKELQRHVTFKIPTSKKVSSHWKAKVLKFHRLVFGSSPKDKKRQPPLFVPGRTKTFTFKSPKARQQLKVELGQQTPKELKYIYLPKTPLPDDPETWTDPILLYEYGRPPIIINGFVVSITEPINAGAYSVAPLAEERRVIDHLEARFAYVKKELKKRGMDLTRTTAAFTPICGTHPFYGGDKTPEDILYRLGVWRRNYWHRTDPHNSIKEWLTAIRLDAPFEGAIGRGQMRTQQQKQEELRKKRRRWRTRRKADED